MPTASPTPDAPLTSAPTVSTASAPASAIPTPSPTPIPNQTLTPDDLKISTLIKSGLAKWDALVVPFAEGSTISEMVGGVRAWETFFAGQVALADAYAASSCTALALEQYRRGMREAQAAAEVILDWVDAGMNGDTPEGGDLHPAYEIINDAVRGVEAQSC